MFREIGPARPRARVANKRWPIGNIADNKNLGLKKVIHIFFKLCRLLAFLYYVRTLCRLDTPEDSHDANLLKTYRILS